MSEVNDQVMVAALLRERAAYVVAGKTDRVRQVDEQLALRGYEVETRVSPTRHEPPKGRRTADQASAAKSEA